MKTSIHKVFTIMLAVTSVNSVQPPAINPSLLSQSSPIGECQSCKLFIDSFKKGLERTSRGKFEGGDAAWEEEKLKISYKRSEIRLVDIQEGLCKEEKKYAIQCHNIAEKAEEFIEEWWAQDSDKSEDLYDYICIQKLKLCCPKHHYGKDCTPCPGDHANLCTGNGKCKGDGTRKGNGNCLCDEGYIGENCDSCAVGYYLSYKDDNKMLCSKCHPACLGGCLKGSQRDCIACRPGFLFSPEKGCLDINECNDVDRCKRNEYCLNSLGSFACMECDKSCDGCHGPGPDMCINCIKGFEKKDDVCVADGHDDLTVKESMTR